MKNLALSKEKIKILLLEGVHPQATEMLKSQGYTNIDYYDKSLPEEKLYDLVRDAHILGIRSRTQVTEDLLKHAKKLFAIGCFCIGVNQVDLLSTKRLGIPVFNAPFSNTRSVAELVIAEAIMLFRGIPEKNHYAHLGGWKKSAKASYEVRNKNLGIVGYGHIGKQVSVLGEALGMNVYFYDIENTLTLGNAQKCHSLKELLEISDIVTLHVPGNETTKNMISQKELSYMKKGSYLINASRGNVVVIEDLRKALADEHILGAAIDVFPEEPKSNDERFCSELQEFQNVILTPHIGGSTLEAQENIAIEVTEKLIKYSDNGSTTGAVNFVEVSLPSKYERSRFLHIHKNTPGVLEAVNNIFSSKKINISSQYLQTDSDIGYLICDVDQKVDADMLMELKNIPHTIRARVLY